MMGGALGLAVLASVAASRTDALAADGESQLEALTGGYSAAFVIGAIFAASGAVIGAAFLRTRPATAGHGEEAYEGVPATAESNN
jgi:hypothetical protein